MHNLLAFFAFFENLWESKPRARQRGSISLIIDPQSGFPNRLMARASVRACCSPIDLSVRSFVNESTATKSRLKRDNCLAKVDSAAWLRVSEKICFTREKKEKEREREKLAWEPVKSRKGSASRVLTHWRSCSIQFYYQVVKFRRLTIFSVKLSQCGASNDTLLCSH